MVILKMPFSPKIFTMPLVMAVIFSFTLVRLRIARRRLVYEREQKEVAKSKVELLNSQLKELLHQRTERLIAAQDQVTLAQARADIGAMASGAIHDINNALTAISLGWEGLEDAEEEELGDYQLAISSGLSKAMKISAEFKSFLRPPEGESVEVHGLLERLISLLRRSMGPGQELQLERGAEGELYAQLSEGHLTQVLMNLVVNARDALQHQTGNIVVSVSASSDRVTFKVSDDGVGMSPELQQRIFEPFFTTKDEGEGTGLGLHVIDHLIKRAQGELILDSAVGRGTTFTIILPRAQP